MSAVLASTYDEVPERVPLPLSDIVIRGEVVETKWVGGFNHLDDACLAYQRVHPERRAIGGTVAIVRVAEVLLNRTQQTLAPGQLVTVGAARDEWKPHVKALGPTDGIFFLIDQPYPVCEVAQPAYTPNLDIPFGYMRRKPIEGDPRCSAVAVIGESSFVTVVDYDRDDAARLGNAWESDALEAHRVLAFDPESPFKKEAAHWQPCDFVHWDDAVAEVRAMLSASSRVAAP